MAGCLLPSCRGQMVTPMLHVAQFCGQPRGSAVRGPCSGASSEGAAAWLYHRNGSVARCSSKHGTGDQLSSDAADIGESSSSSSSSSSSQQRTPRRRRKVGKRREDYAFVISRADLTWEQPWMFEQASRCAGCRLDQGGTMSVGESAAPVPACLDQTGCPPTWPTVPLIDPHCPTASPLPTCRARPYQSCACGSRGSPPWTAMRLPQRSSRLPPPSFACSCPPGWGRLWWTAQPAW